MSDSVKSPEVEEKQEPTSSEPEIKESKKPEMPAPAGPEVPASSGAFRKTGFSGLTAEEAKLKSKFPIGPMGGHSVLLQKRLVKGPKYFDSGDYQMAKQTPKSRIPPLLAQPTGEAIPTPDSVPVRKTSIIQQNKISSTAS